MARGCGKPTATTATTADSVPTSRKGQPRRAQCRDEDQQRPDQQAALRHEPCGPGADQDDRRPARHEDRKQATAQAIGPRRIAQACPEGGIDRPSPCNTPRGDRQDQRQRDRQRRAISFCAIQMLRDQADRAQLQATTQPPDFPGQPISVDKTPLGVGQLRHANPHCTPIHPAYNMVSSQPDGDGGGDLRPGRRQPRLRAKRRRSRMPPPPTTSQGRPATTALISAAMLVASVSPAVRTLFHTADRGTRRIVVEIADRHRRHGDPPRQAGLFLPAASNSSCVVA